MANNIKAKIRDSWGENRRIDGPYDASAAEAREILTPILDYRLNASYAEMKLNVPFVWKFAGKVLLALLAVGTVLYFLLK